MFDAPTIVQVALPDLCTTFQTRLPHHPALDAYGALFGKVERKLHAAFAAGRHWRGDLQTSFYQPFNITSNHLDSVRKSLEGRLKAVEGACRYQAGFLRDKAGAKRRQATEKTKLLDKARKQRAKLGARRDEAAATIAAAETDLRSVRATVVARAEKRLLKARGRHAETVAGIAACKATVKRLEAEIHGHNRRVRTLEDRAKRLDARAFYPSLAFGSRKLFARQNLVADGDADGHARWLDEWRSTRDGHFFVEGLADAPDGNRFVRLHPEADGTFAMELRLPDALARLADGGFRGGSGCVHYVLLQGLRFEHGRDVVASWLHAHRLHALDPRMPKAPPVTYRFVRDGRGWRVCVTATVEVDAIAPDFADGALGVDLNEHDVVVTRADRDGNPVGTWTFPLCAYGRTEGQRKDIIRQAAAGVAELAFDLNLPLVREKLDFAAKKAALACGEHSRRARMLSSFAYAEFGKALESAALRFGVALAEVNPAYTSLIGRVSYAPRYGLSVHAAAALAVARRAMRMSERAPAQAHGDDGKPVVAVRLDSGDHVALPAPARRPRRHVWSSWRTLSSGLKAVHVARARARREARSAATRAVGDSGVPVAGRRGGSPPPRASGGTSPG